MQEKQVVKFEVEVCLKDTRRILLVKSHSGQPSMATSQMIVSLAPVDEYKILPPIEDVQILIAQEKTRGQSRTPEERVQAAVKDFGQDLRTRVYNAIMWHLRRRPDLFEADWRVLYFPHGDARIALMVTHALYGIFGQWPEIVNQIPLNGELIINPEMPLIDLDECRYMGRKLRDRRDELLRQQQDGLLVTQPNDPKPQPLATQTRAAIMGGEQETVAHDANSDVLPRPGVVPDREEALAGAGTAVHSGAPA